MINKEYGLDDISLQKYQSKYRETFWGFYGSEGPATNEHLGENLVRLRSITKEVLL